MAVVYFDQVSLPIKEGEPVLDTLINHKIDVDYGCKSGVCQSCIMQAVDGDIPTQAQKGLNNSQIEQGLFLACQCHPENDFYISSKPVGQPFRSAKVAEKKWLSDSVIQLTLAHDLTFQAGQFVNLKSTSGVIRSYSIASLPNEGLLEFHIKHLEDGAFSQWLAKNIEQGDEIEIQGPYGDCYYQESESEKPLLLGAMNTGLAPIWGILKSTLAQEPNRPIELFIGAKDEQGHYLIDEIEALNQQHSNLVVHRYCLHNHGDNHQVIAGDIYQGIKDNVPDCKGYEVYLCGAESFVKKLKKQCFLSGANMGDIHSDAFVAG